MGARPVPETNSRLSSLGIVVALPEEVRCLTGRRPSPQSVIDLSDSVRVKLSGMGAERASEAALQLVEHGANALLSWGTAAGLVAWLAPGDLVLPQTVVDTAGDPLEVDRAWHRRVCSAVPLPFKTAALGEAAAILIDAEQKRALQERTGAVAADMESAAVARVAKRHGVLFLVVRVVADPFRMAMPATAGAALTPAGDKDWMGLIGALAHRPHDLVSLFRINCAFRCAQATLKRVAGVLGPSFLAFEVDA